jgi:hypothetical protein
MALDELGATAFYTHDYATGYAACEKLLKENRLPQSEVERVRNNYNAYATKLAEMQQQQAKMQQAALPPIQEPVNLSNIKSTYIPPRAARFKERKK